MQKEKAYYAKFGAIALPGKNPGCVVIIGTDNRRYRQKGCDSHVIEEYEDWDSRKLLQSVFSLNELHRPKKWIGDDQHNVIKHFRSEMNEGRKESLYFSTPSILQYEDAQPYLRILPEIKKLRESEHRQLYMDDDSLILRYMAGIKPDEMAGLVLGDFPAIECLAYAVEKARNWEEFIPSERYMGHPIYGYAPREPARHIHGQPKEVRVF